MNPDDARPEKYFAGYVECISQGDFGKRVVVGNAQIYSVRTDTSPSEELNEPSFLEAMLDKSLWNVFGVNDFVIGCFPENTQAFVFRKPVFGDLPGRIIVPVQVLPWDSFEESSGTPSAAEYLEQRPTGTLTFKYDSLMGKANHPGIVILLDVESRSLFKGFEAIGNRKVRFDNVMRYDGNHAGDGIQNAQTTAESEFVRLANAFADSFSEIKVVAGKFENSEFGLWIPNQYNSYAKKGKHPVLDKEGWVAVSPGGEETSFGDKMDSPAAGSGEENPGGRLRVCDLAKELITTSKELLGLLHDRGYSVRSPQEILTPELEQYLRKELQHLYNGGGVSDTPASPAAEAEPGAEATALATPAEQAAPAEGEEAPRGNQTDSSTEGNREAPQEVREMEILTTTKPADETNGKETEPDEIIFLQKFIKAVKNCGFEYEPRDLVRFHTSVKTGHFTLLGGAPGSGKSSLAKLYAMALLGGGNKMNIEDGFLAIDVNPAWVEPDDVLGYWNLDGKYIPASTGLVPFLRSSIGSNKVRLVCLEEMNLARVEHYFANFMQIFTREENERYLPGISPQKDSHNQEERLKIDSSLRFVGTNNFDETTQNFSARFYDRCNYIELQETSTETFPDELPLFDKTQFDFEVDKETFDRWLKTEISSSMLAEDEKGPGNETLKGVKSIYQELRPLFQKLRIAPSRRVRNEILRYIVNRPFFTGCGEGDGKTTERQKQIVALDEAIAQRVLPRYHINFLHNEEALRKELGKKFKEFGMILSGSVLAGKSAEDEPQEDKLAGVDYQADGNDSVV